MKLVVLAMLVVVGQTSRTQGFVYGIIPLLCSDQNFFCLRRCAGEAVRGDGFVVGPAIAERKRDDLQLEVRKGRPP